MEQRTISSKLTAKCQATIPEEVRKVLGVGPGDAVVFELLPENAGVMLRKATPIDLEFARAIESTLATEWLSEHDEQAYRDL